jgi:uncharacterized membrane protein
MIFLSSLLYSFVLHSGQEVRLWWILYQRLKIGQNLPFLFLTSPRVYSCLWFRNEVSYHGEQGLGSWNRLQLAAWTITRHTFCFSWNCPDICGLQYLVLSFSHAFSECKKYSQLSGIDETVTQLDIMFPSCMFISCHLYQTWQIYGIRYL